MERQPIGHQSPPTQLAPIPDARQVLRLKANAILDFRTDETTPEQYAIELSKIEKMKAKILSAGSQRDINIINDLYNGSQRIRHLLTPPENTK
jgi:hypothetical protein